MVGRNEQCDCGSGKKYKKCCGRPKKTLTQAGILKVIQYLARTCEGEVFKIGCDQLDSIPPEEALGIRYDVDTDCFEFSSQVPPPKPLIQVAHKIPVHGNGRIN